MAACLSILVVEDHDALRESTVELLAAQGHRVMGVASAEEVLDHGSALQPELYLVDLNLPGEDGLSLAARLRAAQPGAGIIMLTARNQTADKIAGYSGGADLYLTKPVDPDELLGAVAALARRLRPEAETTRSRLCVCHATLRLAGPAGEVALSAAEVRLLDALAKAPEQLLERWQVAVNLGMNPEALSDSSLEVRVANLRRKLQEVGADATANSPLRAVRGVGYKLCVQLSIR